jgi:hypothetical protein
LRRKKMKCTTRFGFGWTFAAGLAAWFFTFPSPAQAQGNGAQGQNAVYNNSNTVVGSSAFIDASMFAAQNANICTVLNGILKNVVPTSGAVIDARGLASSTPATSMTCTTANPSPWAGITNPPPSTILLPATSGISPSPPNPIIIPGPWVLPANTHLIGEGDGIPSSTAGTTIQVASSFSGSTILQFGSASSFCPSVNNVPICTGISVENLTLDGNAQSINGISNQYAQTNTYVNRVSFYRVLGTGLLVSTPTSGSSSASSSGPYSNLKFDTGGYSGTSATVCASIDNVNGALLGTRGIHGLSCTSETNDPPAAVLLDASNNSIEDVRIVGFYDGVLVGAHAVAQSNVLINVIGDTVASGPTPVNTVHISTNKSVTDLSIVGLGNMGGSGTYTLWDEVTGPHLLDSTVGIYALGESPSNGIGHSRFSTSPNVAHWTVGTAAPTNSGNPCSQGSLYSCTGSGGNGCSHALWVCAPSGQTTAWAVIK